MITVETAIEIAWRIRDGVLSTKEPKPTAKEALKILEGHKPGFNWITGAACRKALRIHLGIPHKDGWL